MQKNQKTYRNLCKLPLSANYHYLELAMISPSFSEKKEKKNTPAVFALKKKTHRNKDGRKPKIPLKPGAQQTAVDGAGAARDFWREDGALSAARPEPQAALTKSREVCMAGEGRNHLPPGFG